MKQRVYFLINTKSGGRRAVKLLSRLRQHGQNSEHFLEADELAYDRQDEQLAKARASEVVVLGGGDGTLSSLLPQLAGSNAKIGILPLGTGNDLARELGIMRLPMDTSALLDFYRTAGSRELSFFELECTDGSGRRATFINYVSFGYDAKVVQQFDAWRGTKFWSLWRGVWANRAAYFGACLAHLGHSLGGAPELVLDGATRATPNQGGRGIIFANICSIMGMGRSNLYGSAFDENVECIAVQSIFNYTAMLTHYKLPLFHPQFLGSGRAWELSGLPKDVHVQIDGEPRPDLSCSSYRISPKGRVAVLVREQTP